MLNLRCRSALSFVVFYIALLKSSCGCGEEHEVVFEDTQDEFAALRLMSSRGQR